MSFGPPGGAPVSNYGFYLNIVILMAVKYLFSPLIKLYSSIKVTNDEQKQIEWMDG